MPLESNARIAKALAERGYNAEREAVTLLAGATDPTAAIAATVDRAPDEALRITADHVREAIDHTDKSAAPPDETGQSPVETKGSSATEPGATETVADPVTTDGASAMDVDTGAASDPATADAPTVDPGTADPLTADPTTADSPTADPTTADSPTADPTTADSPTADPTTADSPTVDSATAADPSRDLDLRDLEVGNDMTGRSTGTGEYSDFVTTFRDRYERLSKVLRGRVNHRPAEAIANMPGGSDAAMIGLVNDVRSTKSGHWLVELEDTTGTFPALVMKDKGLADVVDEILLDECVAVEGTLADDAGILFADSLHFPDVPRTHNPGGADRHVQAALISDVHVGSDEFMADAWHSFADWLHTPEADPVEYILLAGDMVEGVGVYPDQDEELDIVDIYEQYEAFAEHLKEVPADTEIVMIPGNHDAVRLAEPQPGFNDEIRAIMDVHDAQIVSNPATVSVEGVEVLMYHGVSLDEVIAELPEEKASYDEPHKAMYQLLKKRHVAPQFGGHTRVAPEERDYLVIEDVPDVFHTGHVHKLGWGKYHNVLAVNSGCWQAQTDFQKSVNIDPDAGYAPILDLDTLDMTVRKFS
ncbi:DNA-directed DNA polymerase II small subunit [Halorubrum ezzemoulense]|uniref:DNA-directed DNA polymerase II small subunit n=2 Tax=Halorubrum ezzemoulense TaxID=337243 RepID=UPI00232F82AC|nr:DNA-directed DNA polymerase II small subunit [Halorubrum ezzemoulense]MDB9260211.1 DNA-directed DNA polymerase II small subunit [Halorubrum ezzemoulense]MDB9265597.1 DNA-directed DNA polymerase II small subunit [Halorubrum ezzemoulense]MDB9270572.1 DNA-directed DNA polymerase II small subunit [Halorubrum ezzemoulense]MDB9273406.1 DNA-directed DNA polymerase II small subunit [Halorubrum ezzemoulense]MDB9286977.1 DNA-directed DNA polymerase II small subunit [Halorubrum ezzemoulense]